MRFFLTGWWVAAFAGWVLSSRMGIEHSSNDVARQVVFLMPVWGAPWAVPLALIRAIAVPGGTPHSFELALALGLAVCVLIDVTRQRPSTSSYLTPQRSV